MRKLKKRINELFGTKFKVEEKEAFKWLEPSTEQQRTPVTVINVPCVERTEEEKHSLVELMSQQQLLVDRLQYESQVQLLKSKHAAEQSAARAQATKAVRRDLDAHRFPEDKITVETLRETDKYLAVMGYPPEGGLLEDRCGYRFTVKSIVELIEVTGKDDKDILLECTELKGLPIHYAKNKVDMALRFQNVKAWPNPSAPAVFIFCNEEDRVYMLKQGDGSVFVPINSWSDISQDGILNATINFYTRSFSTPEPETLDPNQKDKFDAFLGTVKLRAEIVEEVKDKLARGEEVVVEFDEAKTLPESEATKRRKQAEQLEVLKQIVRSTTKQPANNRPSAPNHTQI